MADNVSINLDTRAVENKMVVLNDLVIEGLDVIADATSQKIKAYAQTSARWEDRTGDARQGLNTAVTWKNAVLDIAVFHKMDYGVFLELCNSEKYAILQEARDSEANGFYSAVRAMLDNM